MQFGDKTGLKDMFGRDIRIGHKTRLLLPDGEEREFDVAYETVRRTVKSHPDFDIDYADVEITGVVFVWGEYRLFPMVDKNGIPDNERMEIV